MQRKTRKNLLNPEKLFKTILMMLHLAIYLERMATIAADVWSNMPAA